MITAEPLPVTVIGGYLGTGKTTLVNHLLRHADGRRLAVLVNEFGELPIDEDLIEAEEEGIISIAGGCICCSFGNDLIGALGDLATITPRPDHVLIESSGVAIPGAIVSTMLLVDGLSSDGIVVVIDAETVRKNAEDDYVGDTLIRQLSDAEIVVINKIDLITSEQRSSLDAWLNDVCPDAALVPAVHGAVPLPAVLSAVSSPHQGRPSTHSDTLFESIALSPANPLDAETMARDFATGGHGVIRAKGYVTGTDGNAWLIQTVGKRWEAKPAGERHTPSVVCIGLRGNLDKKAIATLVRTLVDG